MVPTWIVGLVAIAAFLCGIIVQIFVWVRSRGKGEGLLWVMTKSGALGCLAMLGVWAAYFILGWLIWAG